MPQQLTVVVTCTDRKSVSPLPSRQARNVAGPSLEARAAAWIDIMSRATDTRPLALLYQGEAWARVGGLEATIRSKGITPRMLVVSAGLGLRLVDSQAPSYSATFATGQSDSVGRDRADARAWWRTVSRSQLSIDPVGAFSGPTLFVLSEVYTAAMAQDLTPLAAREDVVLFGGANGLLSEQRFPSDIGLRAHLGGTAGSLNLRMAAAWLEQQEGVSMHASDSRDAWESWAAQLRKRISYDRQPLGDAALAAWIETARAVRPGLSKTVALRMLRESGMACEQRRFGELFARTLEDT